MKENKLLSRDEFMKQKDIINLPEPEKEKKFQKYLGEMFVEHSGLWEFGPSWYTPTWFSAGYWL